MEITNEVKQRIVAAIAATVKIIPVTTAMPRHWA